MGWLIVGVNGVVAGVLLTAGLAKAVSSDRLADALAELAPTVSGRTRGLSLQAFAFLELFVAAGLPAAAVRLWATVAAGVLGLGFCAVGGLGLLKGSKTPCGCFGASSTHPFGWANIGTGLAIAAAVPANLAVSRASMPSPAAYSAVALPVASASAALLCLWANRPLVAESLRRGAAEERG